MQLTEELVRLFTLLSHLASEQQRGAELTRLEYLILARLQRDGSMRPGDLAQVESLDPSTLSRRVAAMADRGLVERQADVTDRRAHRLTATDRGLDAFRAEQARRVGLVTTALDHWPEPDRDALARLIHELNDSLQNRTRP
ncbi:MarR family winged helix-turn-helix transcriptional regulator [Micropruina sonneratiae]|uniref:MarR family winged helix-turn-helix transcriptional regulator n=1 Tax=Micropruina sonneratiae TaxID=2986940 RepID=UPI002225D5E9|nr:MarR family transcriptional regulator [Micropruina sp. KQZ13P-5]MCW3158205.1 MarR family transcriptional regulator [Micropruina sp. KQZ13P-5]